MNSMLTPSNVASLTAALVSSFIIIGSISKFLKWIKTSPIRRYIENTAINRISQERLIDIYNLLNEDDKLLLEVYKQHENKTTKIINYRADYDNESHIKIKHLGLVNEVINNIESTNKIKSIVADTIKQQQLQAQIQGSQQFLEIIKQQQNHAGNTDVQIQNMDVQIQSSKQQKTQLHSQINQIIQIENELMATQNQQPQRDVENNLKQIVLQKQNLQQQISQMAAQIDQLEKAKNNLKENNIANLKNQEQQIQDQLSNLEEQNKQILEKQLNASLVIDLIFTRIGKDISDIVDKKVNESDIRSKLAFFKFFNKPGN